jgi:hypothetical protein
VAHAGDDQQVTRLGALVQLDGSQSLDGDGDEITYAWSLDEKPAGSAATLSDPTAAKPTFVADVAGEYRARLIVTDEFGAASQAAGAVTQGSGPHSVAVKIQNRGSLDEVIVLADLGDAVAAGLVRLEVSPLDDDTENCQPAAIALDAAKISALFKRGPRVLKPTATLTISYLVTYRYADATKRDARDLTPGDYQHVATIFAGVLGALDAHPADDRCPHDPLGQIGAVKDNGCGKKRPGTTFGPPLTNVVRK